MKLYFKDDRDRDFFRAYKRVIRELGDLAPYISRDELVMRTLCGGAPKFYLTFELARRNIRCLMENRAIPCNNPLKREMYETLARLTLDYYDRHKHEGVTFSSALMTILAESPAPRFYMTKRSAKNLLCEMLRKERMEQRKYLCR